MIIARNNVQQQAGLGASDKSATAIVEVARRINQISDHDDTIVKCNNKHNQDPELVHEDIELIECSS